MIDFNEMLMFARVVECGGFLAASKKFGIPKSTLSRKISNLEQRLNVRLIQRSTRKIMITDIGREYYQYCLQMISSAEEAESIIINKSDKPTGKIRLTCSNVLMDLDFSAILAKFMLRYPRVSLHVKIFNRDVDIIAEGYDLSLKIVTNEAKSSNLIMRSIFPLPSAFMISPSAIDRYPLLNKPDDLSKVPTVAWLSSHIPAGWTFRQADREVKITHDPRLACDDIRLIKAALVRGVGVGCLPLKLAARELAQGSLKTIFDDWALETHKIVAIYPTRQGLLPSVRALIDFIIDEFNDEKNKSSEIK
ncbi:LysR substrate-binding domain-containing protein [Serratia entomophila]|uniref:LysR family transcriptional regulator n=1 Tax=Serratia entomophila TaxID=42906 RepID=A0ABY5CRM8_9GAMM|nr:LysR substrate-binding domain-containing protein [Serratia entomophila]USV00145.1 LysR family transcriptional regulator [Serratia entomophila]CAI0925016.1 D-malate degradation protein R [Serratia entomophila]CAI0933422.1 D-malate degradation protein R [Serratia entomophila]CAI0951554.1 D-malate degradation protein R [Serratia entomophila]CAI0956532.1 D-malate degradation protein R [Serratia entomophila]